MQCRTMLDIKNASQSGKVPCTHKVTSAARLVHGAERLEAVPLVTGHEAPLPVAQVAVERLLQLHFAVLHVGVGDAEHDDGARMLVREVDALRHLRPLAICRSLLLWHDSVSVRNWWGAHMTQTWRARCASVFATQCHRAGMQAVAGFAVIPGL